MRTARIPWTPAEDGVIKAYIASDSLPRLAKRLGRTERAVQRRAYALGLSFRTEAKRSVGLGLSETARLFQVDCKTVWRWQARGWLRSARVPQRYTRRIAIAEGDLCRFLAEIGALLPEVRPTDPVWRDLVGEARAALLARYIRAVDVVALLGYSATNTLIALRRRHGFPAPVLNVGERSGGHYYERAAVAAWLTAHPRYQTTAIRQALGIEQ